jgi:hypothetical protein
MKAPDPERSETRSEFVETVAGTLLGATVVFLLLQVLVLVVLLVGAVLLPGLGLVTPATGETLGIAGALVAEAALIASLVRMVRRNMASRPLPPQVSQAAPPTAEAPVFERRLEKAMMVGAMLGVCASLLLGLGPAAARIALTVIEAFAALFLLVAIATRWFLTREVRGWAMVALILTLGSLWVAVGPSLR